MSSENPEALEYKVEARDLERAVNNLRTAIGKIKNNQKADNLPPYCLEYAAGKVGHRTIAICKYYGVKSIGSQKNYEDIISLLQQARELMVDEETSQDIDEKIRKIRHLSRLL